MDSYWLCVHDLSIGSELEAEMSDSRERFLAFHELEYGYRPVDENGRFLYGTDNDMLKMWQFAEAQAVRRCVEIATHYAGNSGHPMNFAENVADAIRAEFPEAFDASR